MFNGQCSMVNEKNGQCSMFNGQCSMKFHPLDTSIQPPQRFTNPFRYIPHPLCVEAMKELQQYLRSQPEYSEEIALGKMFGVLVVATHEGKMGFLAAFSGLLADSNDLPYFVPAIADILQPDNYFKQGERLLDRINHIIRSVENSSAYISQKEYCEEITLNRDHTLSDKRAALAVRKAERHRLRAAGPLSKEEEQRLIKESQFDNAEIRRIKDTLDKDLEEKKAPFLAIEQQILSLKKTRKQLSDDLQRWIFDQFVITNAKGETKNLTDIFMDSTGTLPPAGAGECAAPKLLQYAFLHGLRPLCMAEFWWGKPPALQLRRHLNYYPACSGKCKPILQFMLQGLDVDELNAPSNPASASDASDASEGLSVSSSSLPIIYEDSYMIVVNKPTGILSVKGKEEALSIDELLTIRGNGQWLPLIVHRIDMATSGILIFAKDKKTQQALQAQFANHKVQKRYKAIVEGDIPCAEGDINLPLRHDIMDRPRQMVDPIHGKPAVSHFKVIMKRTDEQGRVRTVLYLFPKTGRTHQLRVHCAHPQGLNSPIVGDNLYGRPDKRLMLHAEYIEFTHPATGLPIQIECPAPF